MNSKFRLLMAIIVSAHVCGVNAEEIIKKDTLVTTKMSGYIQMDQTKYFNDTVFGPLYEDGLEIRRAKLTFSGDLGSSWSYSASLGNSAVTRGADVVSYINLGNDTAYVTYKLGKAKFSFGNLAPVFGYEANRGSKDAVFLEDSMGSQFFAAVLNLGTTVTTTTENAAFGASLYVLPRRAGIINTGYTAEFSNVGISGRALFFIPNRDMHVGMSALFENYTSEYLYAKGYSLGTNFGLKGLQSGLFNFQATSIASIICNEQFNVSSMWQLSFEMAGSHGPFSSFTEIYYGVLNNANTVGGNASNSDAFWAITKELSYMVTGETKNYNRETGKIAGVTPNHDYGAVEIAFRSSYLNLNSLNVVNNINFDTINCSNGLYSTWTTTGATTPNVSAWFKASSYTGAIIWHINSNVSLRANFVLTQLPTALAQANGNNGTSTSIKGVGLRAQITW